MKKQSSLVSILMILLLLLGLVAGVFLVQRKVFFLPRAAQIGKISLENSYVFASPLTAKAGGKEKIRVTVFVLSTEGKGIEGKQVSLVTDLPFEPVQPVTDSLGTALFDVYSRKLGQFQIGASVEGQRLLQTVAVRFD